MATSGPTSGNPERSMTFASPEDQAKYELSQRKRRDYERMKHYAALTGIFLAPTLALLPPRKLDLYTVALGCGFAASASQLSKEQYGRGLIDLAGTKYAAYVERKTEERRALRQAKQDEEKHFSSSTSSSWGSALPTDKAKEIQHRLQRAKEQEGLPPKKQGVLTRLWMGGEEEGWRERRAKEHEEALERGQTIGDLIRGQVAEVWGLGSQKEAEKPEGKGEEEFVREKEREREGEKGKK